MHNPSTPYQLWYPNRTLIYFESSSFFLGSPLCRQLYVKFEFEISSDLYLSPCVISTDTVWDRASQNNYSGWWQIRLQFTALKCLVYLLWWSDGQRAKEEILHLSIRREGKWTLFHRWHLERPFSLTWRWNMGHVSCSSNCTLNNKSQNALIQLTTGMQSSQSCGEHAASFQTMSERRASQWARSVRKPQEVGGMRFSCCWGAMLR